MKPWAGHTVDVVIEQLDADGTTKDETRPGEPEIDDGGWGKGDDAEPARKDVVTVRGQMKRYTQAEMMPGLGGDVPNAKGHVLIQREDLDAAEITLAKGDKITSVAGVACELYIIDVVPTVTYRGECYAVQAVYADRPAGR